MSKDNEYIPIESIKEIQNNLRIDQLDKRYIDKDGNRFVIRFGKESRKPEIFRVQSKSDLQVDSSHNKLSTSNFSAPEEADLSDLFMDEEMDKKHKQQIRDSDKAEINSMFPSDDDDLLGDIDLNIETSSTSSSKKFDNSLVNPLSILDEKRYVFDLLKCIDKDKDRILSTLANVKNSRIFELTGDPSENKNIVSNFTREFESEVFHILENLHNRFKEITSFPKSINHYSMNYSYVQKDFLATLENDKLRLDYVLRWEIQEPSLLLVKKFAKMVIDLLGVLNKKEEDQIKTLSFQNQTLFRDSKSAALYCLNDLDFLKRSIENWIRSNV